MTKPKLNPKERGWGDYQRTKQAQAVVVNFQRYRSLRHAEVAEHVTRATIRKRIKEKATGYFDLRGCACTVAALQMYGECTCHVESREDTRDAYRDSEEPEET